MTQEAFVYAFKKPAPLRRAAFGAENLALHDCDQPLPQRLQARAPTVD